VSILVFCLVLRNWLGSNTGLIGAAIMSISPFHIWYSQEARGYALLLFLSLLSLWLLQELIKRQGNPWLKLAFVISTALTFYCHTVAIAFIGFLGVYILLVIPHQRWKEWLTLFSAILLLILPAIYRLLLIPPVASANPFQSFSPLFVAYTIWAFSTGFSLGPTLNELHGLDPIGIQTVLSYLPTIFPVMLFFSVLLLLGAFQLRKKDNLIFWLTALWFIIPLAFALIGSIITVHPFNVRYAVLSFPPFIIFLATGTQSFRGKWAGRSTFVIIGIISIFSLGNYFFYERYHRDDNRAAAQFLSAQALPNDLVIASAAYTIPNLRYYYHDNSVRIVGYPQKKDHQETGALFVNPSQVESDMKKIIGERERFWLFLSRTYHSDAGGYIRKYCDTHFLRNHELKSSGVELVLYKKPVNNN
jgi:4-amino-4-deoxy-L-arabinose transferase-like glycosyltransferase